MIRRRKKDYLRFIGKITAVVYSYYNDTDMLVTSSRYLAASYIYDWYKNVDRQIHKDLRIRNMTPLTNPKLQEILRAKIQENVDLITKVALNIKVELAEQISQQTISGGNIDLASLVRKNVTKNKRRIKLIVTDQYHKTFATVEALQYQASGIEEYVYTTVGDEKVRQSCRRKNGKIYRYDEPPRDGAPGEGVNCRCIAVPVYK